MSHRITLERYVVAFNAGDIETLRPLFAPDALIHGVLGWGRFDAVAPIWAALHHAFEMTLEIEQIAECGEDAIARFVERGHFVNAFRGQPPTHRRSEVMAIEWFRLSEGLIVRRWGARDSASHFKQLGVAG